MNVPLLNLSRQYRSIKKDIDKAIKNVLDKQNFILGEDVHKLEEEVAKYCGTKYAVSCASGTDALILALRAVDIKSGDEVITTSYSFVATSEAIHRVGAVPIFCDISEEDYNMDIKKMEKLITKKTKAILPVHLYGQSIDMTSVNGIAKKHKLKVIEDACQAMGAKYKNKMVGNLGDVAAFSFFPTKNLGGFGDGGILTTNDKSIYDTSKLLRTHGMGQQYLHIEHGYNSRLDTLQAAVLRVKLKHLDKWVEQRRSNACFFNKSFENIPVVIPKQMKNCYHTYHQYT
ncbi:MAG: DegT/DnrJ/EryC1/StrS family aminotransferase, partial [Candidatus Omnitrophica bacterium]|nr:DegT/DnrJ/EryC1/StrS family aminotransferase [Candidatus Omnitrophota bacterium]